MPVGGSTGSRPWTPNIATLTLMSGSCSNRCAYSSRSTSYSAIARFAVIGMLSGSASIRFTNAMPSSVMIRSCCPKSTKPRSFNASKP